MNASTRLVGRKIGAFACVGALLVLSGCMTPAQTHDEFTTDQQSTLSVDEVMERQAMAGAAATREASDWDAAGDGRMIVRASSILNDMRTPPG